MIANILVIVLFQSSAAVIYRLNDSEYALMPPIFHMDNYEECFEDPDGLYCTADFLLVSDEPSPLLTMIQEFSAHTSTHYNHTLLRYSLCIKQTCKEFYEIEKEDLGWTLEACLNKSLHNKYNLKARVSNDFDCSKYEKHPPIDYLDISVAVICAVIFLANFCGTICDHFLEEGKDFRGLRFLHCFSILRNWKKFIAENGDQRLKGLNGVRALAMFTVIVGHSFYIAFVLISTPKLAEDGYRYKMFGIFMNGTIVIQVFLIMSSFVLVYNWLVYSEKCEPSWKMLPKIILMRWLRLTPSYAVILALTTTWFGRLTSGPYWKKLLFIEMAGCRRDWWKHILYINNYFDDFDCMPHAWYLAADTQLYFMAVIVFLICRTSRLRKVVLSFLFILGMLVPALYTYFQNLDGILILSPEAALAFLKNNPTISKIYKKGHTNLIGYIIGMALGYMIYDWQTTDGDPKKLQKYRYLYWTSFPLGCLICFTSLVFYSDISELPIYVHVLFAAFIKPVFGIIMAVVIAGVIIQFEGFYRTIAEWRPLTLMGRLSFSAYLLHLVFIRNKVAMQTTLRRYYIPGIFLTSGIIVLYTFIAAFFFWMLVEAPFGNLVKTLFANTETRTQEKEEGTNKTEDDNITGRNNGRGENTDHLTIESQM